MQLKQSAIVLRRAVKYNPDKRDFVLTESNLSHFEKAQNPKPASGQQYDDIFETNSQISKTESQISYGNRVSQFGFTDMFGQTKRCEPDPNSPQKEEKEPTRKKKNQGGQNKQAASSLLTDDVDFSEFDK